MTELPTFVTNQIHRLAVVAEEQKLIEDLLLKWFAKQGYLNEDLDGTINDLIIDMQIGGTSPAATIKLILRVMEDKAMQ